MKNFHIFSLKGHSRILKIPQPTKKNGKFMCSVCTYETDRRDLNLRINQSNSKRWAGSKRHACTECGYSTMRKADLWKHFVVHTGFRPFTCEVCFKSFKRKDHLELHLRTHIQY
ncbi:hypothetical protein TNCT_31381 [Trichonephila clavata]|uniref:C2H2-type domain-containing protein n=1 Tax=Trichonephila clavata TaxID=2740835 RepID=A0A8X6FGY9_TRICU|nr:hypothetical protein TNCT_31381 [Trichonephila clavata]